MCLIAIAEARWLDLPLGGVSVSLQAAICGKATTLYLQQLLWRCSTARPHIPYVTYACNAVAFGEAV